MTNYGSKDIVITLTDAGAVERDITSEVRSINGIEIDPSVEPSHGFGAQFMKMLYTGFATMAPIVIGGLFNDAANKIDALYVRGASRTLKVTYGGTKWTSVPVILGKYVRKPVNEKATQLELTCQPADAPTEN